MILDLDISLLKSSNNPSVRISNAVTNFYSTMFSARNDYKITIFTMRKPSSNFSISNQSTTFDKSSS